MQARAAALLPGSRVVVCLRPEHLEYVPGGIPATLEPALPPGPTVVHEVRLRNGSTAGITEPRKAGATSIGADLARPWAIRHGRDKARP